MVLLSAVILTYNEERNIERCVRSVLDIADEIVIVDSYSTDSTEEICKRYNVKFIQHPFLSYSNQKNWAVKQTKYSHVLSLDADEALSEELKISILEVKKNWTHDGYYFNRLNNYCGTWIYYGGWYPDRKLRIWNSKKGNWGGINPHDQFQLTKGTTKKFISGNLLHYTYNSVTEHVSQINNFTSIISDSYYNLGNRTCTLFIIGHSLWRFFRDYIIKLGFLQGYLGLIISLQMAHDTFLKYAKLKEIQKNRKTGVISY
jgi:glycosyltransferase involved in cell wall biosynthesis